MRSAAATYNHILETKSIKKKQIQNHHFTPKSQRTKRLIISQQFFLWNVNVCALNFLFFLWNQWKENFVKIKKKIETKAYTTHTHTLVYNMYNTIYPFD